jgi:predicted RNA methylase
MPNTTPRERGTHDTNPTDDHTDALSCPVALATRDFAEVVEYLGEWDTVDGTSARYTDVGAKRSLTGRMLAGNEIGPYCTIDLSQLGGPQHRAVAAAPTDATLDALRPRLVTDDDRLSFKAIGHEQTGRVLVIASHGSILGDHWLAYVEADTLPPYPYAQRDERFKELCQTLREGGHSPSVRRLAGGVIEIEPAERGTGIKASIDALGAVTRLWGNGRRSVEPPRDGDQARRAVAQLKLPAAQATSADANGEPAPLLQQALFTVEPGVAPPANRTAAPVNGTAAPVNGGAPVRRSKVEDAAVEVLARVEVTDGLVVLPDQLERPLYEAVNKVLTTLGGKWNRHRGGHVFPPAQPISDELAAIVDGKVLERMLTGYFPTPRPLAEQLIELADVRAEHLVLEPSAGRGAIAELLAAIVPAGRLYLVERDPTHHQALERAGYRPPQLICDDFLTTTTLPGGIDRIVMNPPFEEQQDVTHVTRAYELLAPGGRLAAVASAGVAYRTDKRTQALRKLIEQSDDGSITENPPKAFKSSGTSTHTVMLALTKPA